MRVYRWDIYFRGRYIYHVYFMEDAIEEDVIKDILHKGEFTSVEYLSVFRRDNEKDSR